MELIEIAVIGFFVGLVGGMFGIGGSIVLIPALTEFFGPDQHLYQATAMIMNFMVSAPAAWQHWRAGAIQAATILRLTPLSILFVVLGVGISELGFFAGPGEAYLRVLFGLFLAGCALAELYRAWRPETLAIAQVDLSAEEPGAASLTWPVTALIAGPAGFVSGLLGVGGGTLAVPLQRRFLGMPIPVAIANSAALVAATAVVGAVIKNYAYGVGEGSVREPLILAVVLSPTAIAGSLLGSRMTHRVRLGLLRNLFVVVLLIAAIRLIHGAMRSIAG